MYHLRNFKKKAKPTEEVLKSQIFQAIKSVSKAVKVVKTFLILKCTRKLAALREAQGDNSASETLSNDSRITREIEALEALKALDQRIVASAIVRLKVSFGGDNTYNPADKTLESSINPTLLKSILQHQRIQDVLDEIKGKITNSIEKNNEIRAKEQSRAAKQTTQKSIFTRESVVDGTKAVFMNSLDNSEEVVARKPPTAKDLVKLNKSLRNQANRMANKSKRAQADLADVSVRSGFSNGFVYPEDVIDDNSLTNKDPSLMMYRPLDQRLPASNSAKRGRSSNNNSSSNGSTHSGSRGRGNGQMGSVGGNSSSAGIARSSSSSSSGIGTTRPSRGASNNSNNGNRPTSAPPAPSSAELVQAAAFGKEWQKTGVHPSWAAKQHSKQQTVGAIPSIGNSKGATVGKKIVFAD